MPKRGATLNPLPPLSVTADNAAMEAEPPKADPPKDKRRWFQFSLRTLLIGTLICAIPCALLGRKIERKRNERNAIEAIKALGGQVFYVHEEYPPTEPPGALWLRKVLGENFFDEIDSVELSESAITDDDVVILNSLPQLRGISARKTRISDAALETLKGSTQVQILTLSDTGVTDAGLECLKGCQNSTVSV
jgi:hypothetical protein